tara:strand:- start:914 stop:1243 length:330 start_codon:yes stop_codon:yes gene_type:complete
MGEQPNLNNWNDFSGEYLKPGDIKVFPLVIVPTKIDAIWKENKPQITLSFEYEGRVRKLGLNKTNQDVVKKAGVMPKDIIGKKLSFSKIQVRNPQLNKMVDGFMLTKVE